MCVHMCKKERDFINTKRVLFKLTFKVSISLRLKYVSVIKNTPCSCKGPEFGSQHPCLEAHKQL